MTEHDESHPFLPEKITTTEMALAIALAVITSVGNLLVIVAVYKDPCRELRTISNYFVVNLAVADLITGLITEPIWALQHWVKENRGNYTIAANVLLALAVEASCLTVLFLTIERSYTHGTLRVFACTRLQMIPSNLFKLALLQLLFVNVTFAAVINITWCATGKELEKCSRLMTLFGYPGADFEIIADCITGQNATDCIDKIEKGEADLVSLDSEHTLIAGKYHNLVPVVAQDYGGDEGTSCFYAVAVVRKNNTGFDITSLKGKKSCHTGANKTAGWNIPVGFLLMKKLLKMDKSCNPFTSVGNFFASSCIPGEKLHALAI
ncbi:negative regulation of tumor necrosis factor (ligand) super member 11 production [Desmophyllum pertusum]|uniref:Negative regulation of tumor necrosis factor (Ligand) super member 11 production n=1 Tax=Desmophyllum pertusum TaxID=174260 RepID=A0A9W9YEC6_9CNID|nr:negative regulation of tumor necrosis factor (ligand) super member 11 production [Desmophyllum pertusum]